MSFYCNGKKGICDKIKNSHGVCPLSCEFGDGTGGYDISDEPMTNGDRIRAMTDEELAYWMTHLREDGHCLNERCQIFQDKTCEECVIDWLKQPVKEVYE